MGHQPSAGSGDFAVKARAPLRLGLACGGTDISTYSRDFGGMVLNATIDRYAYAFINRRDDGLVSYRARGPNIEKDQGLDNLEGVSSLPLHQAVYQAVDHRPERRRSHTNDHHHLVDSPPGAGLGSSSALVVALIEAFCCFFQKSLGPYEIARLAFEIERIDLG